MILYNIPQRTGTDMPNDLLAELAQIERLDYVKQSNAANLAPVDGSASTPATTTCLPRRSTWARPAGSSSRATSSARRCAA